MLPVAATVALQIASARLYAQPPASTVRHRAKRYVFLTENEALYGTRPSRISEERPTKVVGRSFHSTTGPDTSQDLGFTTRGDVLYVIALAWPADGKITIKPLAEGSAAGLGTIKRVQLLGSDAAVQGKRDRDGLQIELSARKTGECASASRTFPPDGAGRTAGVVKSVDAVTPARVQYYRLL